MLARAVAFTAVLLSMTPAMAQPADPAEEGGGAPQARHAVSPEVNAARQAMRQACTADVQTFCSDVQKGGGKILKCLKGHEAELSAECKNAAVSLRAARQGNQG